MTKHAPQPSTTRRMAWAVALLAAASTLTALLLGGWLVDAGGVDPPILRIAPADQNLNQDARVTVHVFLDRGGTLRAASWGVRYDPAVVLAETCQFSASFTNGACNASAGLGLIRMSLVSTEDLGPSVDVAAITFRRHPEA